MTPRSAAVSRVGSFVGSVPLGHGRDERGRLQMVDYKRILQLRAEGVSQRGIADALGCSRNTVAAVFAAANAAGVGFEQVADLGADEVRTLGTSPRWRGRHLHSVHN